MIRATAHRATTASRFWLGISLIVCRKDSDTPQYQPWFDNARRLKDLLGKLEAASLHALEQAEGQTKQISDTVTSATARRSRSPPLGGWCESTDSRTAPGRCSTCGPVASGDS